jgi:hypothetical protein
VYRQRDSLEAEAQGAAVSVHTLVGNFEEELRCVEQRFANEREIAQRELDLVSTQRAELRELDARVVAEREDCLRYWDSEIAQLATPIPSPPEVAMVERLDAELLLVADSLEHERSLQREADADVARRVREVDARQARMGLLVEQLSSVVARRAARIQRRSGLLAILRDQCGEWEEAKARIAPFRDDPVPEPENAGLAIEAKELERLRRRRRAVRRQIAERVGALKQLESEAAACVLDREIERVLAAYEKQARGHLRMLHIGIAERRRILACLNQ